VENGWCGLFNHHRQSAAVAYLPGDRRLSPMRCSRKIAAMSPQLTTLLLLSQIATYFSTGMIVYKEDINVANHRQWVNLGGLFPLRWNENGECGMLSNTAVEQTEAMVFAIRRINEDPLLLPKINLTFDIRDTCAVPSRALELAIDYIHDVDAVSSFPVSGLIGTAFTDSSILVANILGLFEVPQVSYESTGAVLSDKSRYNYFFRTVSSDSLQVKAMASLIYRFNWTYVFAFYSEDTYGEDGLRSLVEELQSQDNTTTAVCFALQIGLPIAAPEDDPAFDMAVEKMSAEWARNSSVAIIFGHTDQARGMLSAVTRRIRADPNSSLSEITWIGSDSWGASLTPKFRLKARGMLAVKPKTTAIPEFSDYFTSLMPNLTENPWFRDYWESTLSCNLTLNNSCFDLELDQNMTLNNQHPNVIRAVYATAIALNNMVQQICTDETLCDSVLITRRNRQVLNGALLRKYLLNVSISGIDIFEDKGLLFNRNGDMLRSYTVFNLQTEENGTLEYRIVGSWDHINSLNLNLSSIEWATGENVPRSVCSLPCRPGQVSGSSPSAPGTGVTNVKSFSFLTPTGATVQLLLSIT